MLGLKTYLKNTVTHLWANRRMIAGVAGTAGAAYCGVITPETANAVGIGIYTAWMTMR